MPYIQRSRAKWLREDPDAVLEESGDLAFLLTTVIGDYIELHGLSWQTITDVLGNLEGVKYEVLRRVQAPYEQTKLDNGSVNIDPLTEDAFAPAGILLRSISLD